MRYKAISADSHVNEHPELFIRHFPAELRDRAPRLIDLDNGGQGWQIEGTSEPVLFSGSAVHHRASKRFDRANYKNRFAEYKDGVTKGVRYEDILPGSWDPVARLKEQDEDKVDAEFLYSSPQVWGAVKAMEDRKLKLACFRAYNDWMAEFCAHNPQRLLGVGLIPVTGIDDALAEFDRCINELKLPTVALESYPSGSYTDPSPEDDRFWSLAVEMDVPVGLHFSIKIPADVTANVRKGGDDVRKAIAGGLFQVVLQKMILDGVFDRHPRLQFVGAEVNCGWIPYYFQKFDQTYKANWRQLDNRLDLLPSEYFKRNVYVTFIIDQVGVNSRYSIGVDRLMWSCDFPHSVSNWPIDVELAHDQLKIGKVPQDEWERIMWRNCADLYKIEYEDSALQSLKAA